MALPYLGNVSNITKTKQKKFANKSLKICELDVHLKTKTKFKNYFRYKDLLIEILRSSYVYKFLYWSCAVSSIGKTYSDIKERVSEHQGVLPITGKPRKRAYSTLVRNHMLIRDHRIACEDFKILGSEPNKFILELKWNCNFMKFHIITFLFYVLILFCPHIFIFIFWQYLYHLFLFHNFVSVLRSNFSNTDFKF